MSQHQNTPAGAAQLSPEMPQPVEEPRQPRIIDTTDGRDAADIASEGTDLQPLSELKQLHREIRSNFDDNREFELPLERFNDMISILSAKQVSSSDPEAFTEAKPCKTSLQTVDGPQEEGKGDNQQEDGARLPEAQPLSEQENYIYTEMIPQVASRLVKHAKTSNAKYTTLISETINGLVDLLIVELRQQTRTCCDLVDALRPVFDFSQPFYSVHYQKVLPFTGLQTSASSSTTTRYIEAKADLSSFTAEDIEWRNSLQRGDYIDAVKTDLGFSLNMWARAEITGFIGAGDKNLGDENLNNVKKLCVKFLKDSGGSTKIFRADSLEIAKFDSKTRGEEWRYNLKPGDEVDALDYSSVWHTCTVIKVGGDEATISSTSPYVTVGFRRYKPDGAHEDQMGKYDGKARAYDQRLELYSVRVQKAESVANGADPEGKIVWKNKPVSQTQTNTSAAGPTSTQATGSGTGTGSNTSGNTTNKVQDDQDMAMVKDDQDKKIFATERYSCKSSFLVSLINKFGEQGGFESLLAMVTKPDVSIDNLFYLVSFFVKSEQMYHKQFVDAFYFKFSDAVQEKLLSATSDHLRVVKLTRIEEIITQVWQKLLLRLLSYFELRVIRSQITLKVGILFMKQSFLAKRIDGAKMIDQVCKNAINEISANSTNSQQASKGILQELIQTLNETNVLEMFFSSKLIHEQLVRRSDGLLKLLLKKKAISPQQIDMVWKNCQKHESLALDLTNVLQNISYSIESTELNYFIDKMVEKPPSVINQKELDLMLGMGRKTNNSEAGLRESQARVLEFFYNYMFDANSCAYLDLNLATKAISSFSEILRLSSVESIITYFGRLIENIKRSEKSYFSIQCAAQFLRLFFNKDGLTRANLIDSFQSDYQLLDNLIKDLGTYMTRVREEIEHIAKSEEQANRAFNKEQIGDRSFFEFFPHKTQLENRITFIKEFAKWGSFRISESQISQIWTQVITNNPATEDHKIVSNWLQTLCDDFLLGRDTSIIVYEDLNNFFHNTVCSEEVSFANLQLEGYYCIQGFFILINLRADKLVVQDDEVARAASGVSSNAYNSRKLEQDLIQVCAKVAPNEMDGIRVLWKIAMDCQEKKVGECVASMLLQVHTSIDFGLDDKITMFEDQFIDSCMQIIHLQNQAIQSRSTEEKSRLSQAFEQLYAKHQPAPSKLRKVQPAEEKRIIACLSYLKMLLLNSEKDGMHNLRPHVALDQSKTLNAISIVNAYEGMNLYGFRQRFQLIPISTHSTVYQLKQLICSQMTFKQEPDGSWRNVLRPHPWTIRLAKLGGSVQIKDSDNGKTLADMMFKNDEVLTIYKKQTNTASKMPLLTPENKINARAKAVFTQIFERYAEEDPDDPTQERVITERGMYKYVEDATGEANAEGPVANIMSYDSNHDKKMSLKDFLYFYEFNCQSKLYVVRQNLAKMGFRDDLQLMPAPGSPEDILMKRKTYQEMPRFKISQNRQTFEQIIKLFDLQTEVSKEAQSLVKMMCTNQEIYHNVLKLGKRQDGEGEFRWDMVFHGDIKMTLYSLEIIDSIIKNPVQKVTDQEQAYRFDWVQRFLKEGGFSQLQLQIKRAFALSQQTLGCQDFASESNNICKRFIDQMLRLMKTFIFAFIIANQEPTSANDFLQLKRNASTLSDQQQASGKIRESSLNQSAAENNAAINNASSFASQDATDKGHGPAPQKQFRRANDSDEANIGEEDQAEIERALRESEDLRSRADSQDTQKVETRPKKEENASGGSELEQAAFFKSIVSQIRDSGLVETLIEQVNFVELQTQLLEILTLFLQNRGKSSKEDEKIISSALSLWSAAIIQKNELISDFYSWTRRGLDSDPPPHDSHSQISSSKELLLHGIYNSNILVRTEFQDSIELICEKVTTNIGERPLLFVMKVLMSHFPNAESSVSTRYCGEYFNLFGALIKQYVELLQTSPEEADQASISVSDLLKQSFQRLKDHNSSEKSGQLKSEDSTLIGLIELVKELLVCYSKQAEYDEVIEMTQAGNYLHEFYYELLYYMPNKTKGTENKCKSKNSRTQAYKLLYQLTNLFKPREMCDFLENYLWPMIKDLLRPGPWRYQPSAKLRSSSSQFSGINNLGNICYMISMLQQLFMVPQFRYQLFKAIDNSPEDIKTYKERQVDDNLLRQFQILFGNLELSLRASADPFDFCFAFKDQSGDPTSVGKQQDSQEFLHFFFDRVEKILRPTSQKYLLQDTFRGTHVIQKTCQSCGNIKFDINTEYTLTTKVENTQDLYSGLSKIIEGDLIEDYHCDGCNQKVILKKRTLLGQTPNVLIVHLQRIVFDFNTFGNKKINTKLSFPKILELSKFSFGSNMKDLEVKGEDDKQTAQLRELLSFQEDDYVYRLVGINIHRGVADHGHYWSYINTRRGKDEPDPVREPAAWLSSNQSQWKQFNDDEVSDYDISNLERDSFGGDASNLTQDELYISNTSGGGGYGKNAYMLIYEKKLKQPIREVVNKQTDAAVYEEEEKTRLVNYSQVERFIPDWIDEKIKKGNTEFVIDRQVFHNQFFLLIKLTLSQIATELAMTKTQYNSDYQPYFRRMFQMALSIGQKVMLDYLSHFHDNSTLQSINDSMSTILTFSESHVSFVKNGEEQSLLVEWIENVLLEDQCAYYFHLMFNCPDLNARTYCGQLIANVINKAFTVLQLCEEQARDRDHPKVRKLRQVLEQFMALILSVIHTRECQKNWTRLAQFYDMIRAICTGGKAQAEYLLQRNNASIVVEICDLILQRRSPKAKLDENGEQRVEMGGSANRAPFGPLVAVLSHVIRCLHTKTMDQAESKTFVQFSNYFDSQQAPRRVEQTVFIDDEALLFLAHKDFINIIMTGEYDIESFAQALAHVCYANKNLTKEVLRNALSTLVASNYNRISQYLQIVRNLITLDDKDAKTNELLQIRRFEWIFGFPYHNCGLEEGETHRIGLDSLFHNIKGEVYSYRSMLTYDHEANNCLLHLLWRYKGRMETYTLECLSSLSDIITSSDHIMELFSVLPGVTYQFARYTDWIQPFLMTKLHQLNAYGSSGAYTESTKEDIVRVMSQFEVYEAFLSKKDKLAASLAQGRAEEESKQATVIALEAAPGEASTQDRNGADSHILKSSPPAYIICQCTDENYLNVIEHEGVLLSMSYMKGTYVTSRPTGYTNLAISAAFLAPGNSNNGSQSTVANNAQAPSMISTSAASQNKSANAMLSEMNAQKAGQPYGMNTGEDWQYAENGMAPLRQKKQGSSHQDAQSGPQDAAGPNYPQIPPNIIVDNGDEWNFVNNVQDDDDGYTQDGEGDAKDASQQQSDFNAANEASVRSAANAAVADNQAYCGAREIDQLRGQGGETFENWSGDAMQTSADLVYKLRLSNTTDQHVKWKITFERLNDQDVNLSWPINGFKGKLVPGENLTVAVMPKIVPGRETQENGKFELEKLKVNLSWHANLQSQNNSADGGQDGMLAASNNQKQDYGGDIGGAIPLGQGPIQQPDIVMSSEKNCSQCTMLNPRSATRCSICDGKEFDN